LLVCGFAQSQHVAGATFVLWVSDRKLVSSRFTSMIFWILETMEDCE
jgi:hypothetical protein